jgi:ABC-type proline/glycine betaine transport system permease subunit
LIAATSLLLADSGPVIPKFGQASNCIVQNKQFCAGWFVDNFSSRFAPRLVEHIELTLIAVGIGMLISFTAAIIAYKQDWFERPFSLVSAFLYTIPSLALFELLVPITGINRFTAQIGLVSYTLLILFRNTLAGLRGVPRDALEAARAMGLTPRQRLLQIELPLALPAIRPACASPPSPRSRPTSAWADSARRSSTPSKRASRPSSWPPASSRWRWRSSSTCCWCRSRDRRRAGDRGAARSVAGTPAPLLVPGHQHLEHRPDATEPGSDLDRDRILGIGFVNVLVALVILAGPVMLTNAYVGVNEVDPDAVQAARAMGMKALQVLLRVELPLALPLIFAGIRTATVYVVATATLATFAGGGGLGDIIVNEPTYGTPASSQAR